MTLQEILFIVSVVFFVLAAAFIVLAVVVFFARNIPDVRADLSGKKRAAAVAEIAAQRPGRDRRKGVARVEPTSGTLDSGSLGASPLDNPLNQVPHVESVVTPAPAQQQQPVVVEQPREAFQPQPSYQVTPAAEEESDDSATTILPDDDASTTILGAEAASEEVPIESVGASSSSPAAEGGTSQPGDPAPASDDSATTILPADDSATTILPSDDSATTILPEETAPAALEGFNIVRKIILRESENVITAT